MSTATQTARAYLQDGNIAQAVQILRNFPVEDQRINDARILTVSRFVNLERARCLGTTGIKEVMPIEQQIVQGILFVLQEIDDLQPLDPTYQTGVRKLRFSLFEEAKSILEGVDMADKNYLRARHNYCVAAFAAAATDEDIETVLGDLDTLEVCLLHEKPVDLDLLISFLYNRSEIYKALGHSEVARYDLEKLRILGSELGLEPE